jgi:hypothetical protein
LPHGGAEIGSAASASVSIASMSEQQFAWHYTTAIGLINIVQRHRLWAGSAAYMNDASDIETGRAALRRAIEEREPALEEWELGSLRRRGVLKDAIPHNYFLLCGSTQGDELTLWRSYGAEKGAEYAIALDQGVELEPVMQNASERHPEPAPPGWYEEAYEYTDEGERYSAYDPDRSHAVGKTWRSIQYVDGANEAARQELTRLLDGIEKRRGRGRRVELIWTTQSASTRLCFLSTRDSLMSVSCVPRGG